MYTERMAKSIRNIRKLRRFLAVKEVVMLSLVVTSFVLLALEHYEHLSHEQLLRVEIFEVMVSLIFLAEFLFELHYARNKRLYMKHHWFYLLAAIPIPTTSFEILKGIRALRLLKLLKIFAHLRYERNTTLFQRK